MSVALVHDFKTEVSAVEDISPGTDDATLRVHDGLVEVESIQVEGRVLTLLVKFRQLLGWRFSLDRPSV